MVGFVFSMAATLPGELSYDSVIQLLEGRAAAYSGWHPPVMSWLLGLSDAALPGAALFVGANALVLFGAMLSLLWIVSRLSWWAAVVAAICVLLPQFVIYQGTVWKDVLFANAAIAGFVLLAHAAFRWKRPALRLALLLAAFLFLIIAALARQNGALLLMAASACLACIARCNGDNRAHALMKGASALLAAVAVMVGSMVALSTRVAPDRGAAKQVRLLELYDLVGALKLRPNLELLDLQRRDATLLDVMRSDGPTLYSPMRSDTLVRSARLQSALAKAPDDILHRSWLGLVLENPMLYLRERAAVFHWVLLTPKLAPCVPYVVGLRGPPQTLQQLGLKQRFTPRDKLVGNYGRAFVGTPAFSHATFFALALLELAFLFYRRRTTDTVFVSLLSGTLAFSASFFFMSIACDYRYLYLLDSAALVTLFYITTDAHVCKALPESAVGIGTPGIFPGAPIK